MRIFAFSNTTNNIPIPTGELPVDDDGYLYVLAFGQSNMTGGYPTDVNDPDYLNHGDKTNPVQSYYGNLGEWQPLTYGTGPIRANGNNIAITFCKEMERLYNVKIRLIHSWAGGRGIECWDEDYTNTDEMYTELF